jgi:hypothetical protein
MKIKHQKKVYKHFDLQEQRKAEKKRALKGEAEATKNENKAQISLQQATSQDEIDQAKKTIKESQQDILSAKTFLKEN